MGARDLTIAVLVVVVAIVLLPMVGMSVWGMGMMGPWPMADGMMGWRPGWGGGLITPASVLLVVGVALVVLGITSSRDRRDQTPFDVLKYRLARGEITKQQYDGLREVLS